MVGTRRCMILAVILIHITYAATASNENDTDEQALISFKALITSDPHGVLSSWIISNSTNMSSFCSWQGVGCSSRRHPRRVTSLELMSSNLTGTISPHLTNLTFLHTLNLKYNLLSGSIPWELGSLRHLSVIDIRFNSLAGEIPESLTNLPKLRRLSLLDNKLVGEIPANFSRCKELEWFHVGDNQLTGPIPTSFGSLPKLVTLAVFVNNLVGGIPSSLGNISSLEYLDVSGIDSLGGEIPESLGQLRNLLFLDLALSGLTGNVPRSIFNMSSIKMFELQGNNLSGVLPDDIGLTLPNLQYFLVYHCQFSGRIPQSLLNASQLRRIHLGRNQFQGPIPSNFGNLRDLEELALYGNQLQAKWEKDWDLFISLSNCTKLQVLDLSDNDLEGVLPPSVLNFSTRIEKLALTINKIHGSLYPEIRKLVNLSTLNLGNNLLTRTIPVTIGELSSLGFLDLSDNNFYGEIPPTIGNLTHLANLYLNGNNLQGVIPKSLERLHNIATLNLSNNQLSGIIPKQLVSLPSLTNSLDISSNFLTGQIPVEVGSLVNLVLIDLSVNRLSGEIPSTVGKCVELARLYLHGNHIHGAIPSSFSSLRGLQELDMSRNNLSGEIPEFFTTFPYLEYLNLSYNNLEGPVPVTGIFSNRSRFSVAGNEVCGGIPNLLLPQCPHKDSNSNKHRARKVVLICTTSSAILLLLVLLICSIFLYSRRQQSKKASIHPPMEDQHWQVSFSELQRATNQFSPGNLIGTGSFGSVYRGFLGPNHQDVAIKVFNLVQQGAERSFLAECDALRTIRHRNLIKIITACSSTDHQGNDFKALVYEFMPNRDLDYWLHRSIIVEDIVPNRLTMAERVNISLDVAQALDYLHHQGQVPIVHCDLKPSNILLDKGMIAHIGDFGLSRFIDRVPSKSVTGTNTSSEFRGSIGYVAPEYGTGGQISMEGDLYSYGVLLLEMFTGKRPTDGLFQGGHTLRSYVMTCHPDRFVEIIDPTLLPPVQGDTRDNNGYCSELDVEKVQECITSIFRVGLQCSEESPKLRMGIKDVIKEVLVVRDVLTHLI